MANTEQSEQFSEWLFRIGHEKVFSIFQQYLPSSRQLDVDDYIYVALPELCGLDQKAPLLVELARLWKTEIGRRAISMAKVGYAGDFARLINKLYHHSYGTTYGRLRVYAVKLPPNMRGQGYIFEQLTLFITLDEYACGEKRNVINDFLTLLDGRFSSETVINGVADFRVRQTILQTNACQGPSDAYLARMAISDSDRDKLLRMLLPQGGVQPSQALKHVIQLLLTYQIGISNDATYRLKEHLVHCAAAVALDAVIIPGKNMGVIETMFKIKNADSMLFETEPDEDGELEGFPVGENVNQDAFPFEDARAWFEMYLEDPHNIMHADPSRQVTVIPNFTRSRAENTYPSCLIVYGIMTGFLEPREVAARCEALLLLDGFDRLYRGDLYCFSKLSFCQAEAREQLKYVGSNDLQNSDFKAQVLELIAKRIGDLPQKVTDSELEKMSKNLRNEGYNDYTDKETKRGMLAWLHFNS